MSTDPKHRPEPLLRPIAPRPPAVPSPLRGVIAGSIPHNLRYCGHMQPVSSSHCASDECAKGTPVKKTLGRDSAPSQHVIVPDTEYQTSSVDPELCDVFPHCVNANLPTQQIPKRCTTMPPIEQTTISSSLTKENAESAVSSLRSPLSTSKRRKKDVSPSDARCEERQKLAFSNGVSSSLHTEEQVDRSINEGDVQTEVPHEKRVQFSAPSALLLNIDNRDASKKHSRNVLNDKKLLELPIVPHKQSVYTGATHCTGKNGKSSIQESTPSTVQNESIVPAAFHGCTARGEVTQQHAHPKRHCNTTKKFENKSTSERKLDERGGQHKASKSRTFTLDDDHALITFWQENYLEYRRSNKYAFAKSAAEHLNKHFQILSPGFLTETNSQRQ